MQCTKCQECRKTYYCVVVQGMRWWWCFCFVSCHKWSILDVQFQSFKTIETAAAAEPLRHNVRCRYFPSFFFFLGRGERFGGGAPSFCFFFHFYYFCLSFATFCTVARICVETSAERNRASERGRGRHSNPMSSLSFLSDAFFTPWDL